MEVLEPAGGDGTEQGGKLVLPLCAVAQNGVLQGRAIQQNKLDVQNGFLGLHIVGHLIVSKDIKKAFWLPLHLWIQIYFNILSINQNFNPVWFLMLDLIASREYSKV